MCGIFGWSLKPGAVDNTARGILASMLSITNDSRGGHSWGICGLQKDTYEVKRGMGKLMPNAHLVTKYDTMYAHTRFATQGKINIENAHPFEFGNIIGAHNGVIGNHQELNRIYNRRYEVDSMHLFAHLSEGRDFKDILGYGAIEWFEKGEQIYFSRLEHGSLAVYGIGKSDDKRGIIWSSDEDHIKMSLRSAGLEGFEYIIEEGQVYAVKGGKLFKDHRTLTLGERFQRRSPVSFHEDENEDMLAKLKSMAQDDEPDCFKCVDCGTLNMLDELCEHCGVYSIKCKSCCPEHKTASFPA